MRSDGCSSGWRWPGCQLTSRWWCWATTPWRARAGLGHLVNGGVAVTVMRRVSVPVVLAPRGANVTWRADRPARILVPLDGSEHNEAVLPSVRQLAARIGAQLVLMRVVVRPPVLYVEALGFTAYDPQPRVTDARDYLDLIAARLRDKNIDVRCRAEAGESAVATIVRVAQEEYAGLVAIATHGRSGRTRAILGSVTTGMLHHGKTPLFVVRAALAETASARGSRASGRL